MKTHKDPRHLERIAVMQELYAWNFSDKNPLTQPVAVQISENLPEIDKLILKAAPAWPIEKINKIDLAILRQAIFELTVVKKAPSRVIVDEAVEIAKEYSSDSSAKFINGVLGKLIEDKQLAT